MLVLATATILIACSADKNEELQQALLDYQANPGNKTTITRILQAIQAGANPNYDYEGFRPIDAAIEQSHLELVRVLIKKGFKPADPELLAESVAYSGTDALGISRLLLKAGANPNGGPDYASPISRAIEANNLPAVKLLLEHGARLRNSEDEDPFELAARSGHIAVLEFLFTTNIKPNDTTELLLAGISSNNPEVVNYLLESGMLSSGNEKDLFQYASYGLLDDAPDSFDNAKKIIKLLEAKNLKAPPEAFDPVVIGSAMLANLDVLNYALAKGGSVNATSDNGKTALMTIASVDLLEVIAESYREDASLALPQRFSNIETRHIAIAKFLLQKGADPNLMDEHGRTALMYAAKTLQLPLVDLLLAHKAKVNLQDKVGKTARDYAYQARPKSPDEQDRMANYLATAFGLTPELIAELQQRSDQIARQLQ